MRSLDGKGARLLRIAPLALCVGLVGAYIIWGRDLSVDQLLAWTPQNPLLAILVLLGMYALKALSLVFPILILHVVGGSLFPTWAALLIYLAGTALAMAVPYWEGRLSGGAAVERFMKKHPKVKRAVDLQRGSDLFLCFVLRVVNCLALDVVSLYLGSLRVPFGRYLLGSLLGMLPCTVAATLVGTTMTDPSSPAFRICLTITIILAVASTAGYIFYVNRKLRQDSASQRAAE